MSRGVIRFVRPAIVAAADSLLFNESRVDQMFSRASSFNDNPPTGVKLSFNLSYALARIAEKTLQLRGQTLERYGANRRGGPRTVVVLNLDSHVGPGGVLVRVELNLP
jgi:hypothetical protein